MTIMLRAILLASLSLLYAQTSVLRREPLVNAASQRPTVAPGTLALILGAGLQSAKQAQLEFPGRKSVALQILRASDQRLDVWIPFSAPIGEAQLRVGVATSRVTLLPAAPGLFSANALGWGSAESVRPFTPGETASLPATGLRLGDRVDVYLGGQIIRGVVSKGQGRRVAVRFRVPPAGVTGCAVPVLASKAEALPSNSVTLTISRSPGSCRDGEPIPSIGPGKNALVFLTQEKETKVTAMFFSHTSGQRITLPPLGSCATLSTSVTDSLNSLLLAPYGDAPLDAGPSLALNDGRYQIEAPGVFGTMGVYHRTLSSELNLQSPWLQLTGNGGPDVPGFTIPLKAPRAFTWSNQASIQNVRRNADLPFEWRDAPVSGWMSIVLISRGATRTETAYCTASASAGRFVIPKMFLTHLPGSTVELYLLGGLTDEPPQTIPGFYISAARITVRSAEVPLR